MGRQRRQYGQPQQQGETEGQVEGGEGQGLLAVHAGQQGQQGTATGQEGDEFESVGYVISQLFAT